MWPHRSRPRVLESDMAPLNTQCENFCNNNDQQYLLSSNYVTCTVQSFPACIILFNSNSHMV